MAEENFDTICLNGIKCLSNSLLKLIENTDSEITSDSFDDWDKMKLELNKTFLGQYYIKKSRIKIRSHTALNIKTYTNWVISRVEDTFFSIYLYLFGILTFIETPDPLIYFENCLQYIRHPDSHTEWDFEIFKSIHSGPNKFTKVLDNLEHLENENQTLFNELEDFILLLDELKILYENNFRNAIAHSDYRVEQIKRVIVYSSGAEEIYNYESIVSKFDKLSTFLNTFYEVTSSYSSKLIPGYSISFSRGPRY